MSDIKEEIVWMKTIEASTRIDLETPIVNMESDSILQGKGTWANGITLKNLKLSGDSIVIDNNWTPGYIPYSSSVGWELLKSELLLTAAQVKKLNSEPQQIVVAPGAWKAIIVDSVVVGVDYWTAAYATNVNLFVAYDSATAGDWGGTSVTKAAMDTILTTTADKIIVSKPDLDEFSFTINKWLTVVVSIGDPATWDSPVRVTVFYRIISL